VGLFLHGKFVTLSKNTLTPEGDIIPLGENCFLSAISRKEAVMKAFAMLNIVVWGTIIVALVFV